MPLLSPDPGLNDAVTPVSEIGATGAEQSYRSNAYGLLATVLRAPPGGEMLDRLGALADTPRERDDLGIAMALLGLSAQAGDARSLEEEFHDLFIGLGRGELVPYGSWYQTGFLMERPLGTLRDDLRELGLARAPEAKEPEDHVAALCEVLALLIGDNTPIAVQRRFFDTHMGPWMGRFFGDLEQAQCALFYKAVGRFGAAFMAFEQRYLSMPA
jgi:TorA maturation chaperone TorD